MLKVPRMRLCNCEKDLIQGNKMHALATKALESCPPALGLLLQQGMSSCFCLCPE